MRLLAKMNGSDRVTGDNAPAAPRTPLSRSAVNPCKRLLGAADADYTDEFVGAVRKAARELFLCGAGLEGRVSLMSPGRIRVVQEDAAYEDTLRAFAVEMREHVPWIRSIGQAKHVLLGECQRDKKHRANGSAFEVEKKGVSISDADIGKMKVGTLSRCKVRIYGTQVRIRAINIENRKAFEAEYMDLGGIGTGSAFDAKDSAMKLLEVLRETVDTALVILESRRAKL